MAKTIRGLARELERARKRADAKREECKFAERLAKEILRQRKREAFYARRSVRLCSGEIGPTLEL